MATALPTATQVRSMGMPRTVAAYRQEVLSG